jgi:putative membrane protein
MTTSQSNLSDLSRYVFKSPNWQISVFFSLALAAVVGASAFQSMEGGTTIFSSIIDNMILGVFFIGVPTLLASFFTPPIDRMLGGKITYNRSSLLALVCEIIVVVCLLFAKVVDLLFNIESIVYVVLIASLAIIFAFRLAIVMAISHKNPCIASIPASIQTVTAAAIYAVAQSQVVKNGVGPNLLIGPGSGKLYFQSYAMGPKNSITEIISVGIQGELLLLVGMSIIYALGVWGLIVIIDRPWRKTLGVSGFDFIRGFIDYIAEDSRGLEDFFESIGESAVVPVTVMSYADLRGKQKACFSLPMLHPGPMGTIGGGNLPESLARDTEGMAFTPHATAGHDFNLTTAREVDSIISVVKRAIEDVELYENATRSVRSRVGEAEIVGQMFGDSAMLIVTYSPGCADDIDYAVGLSAMAEARGQGLRNVMLIDAHNCNNGTRGGVIGHVTPGSQRSFDLFEAAKDVSKKLVQEDQNSFELGVAWDKTKWGLEEGMGPLGIRVAVIKVGDQETAYVQIDGNNMDPGLRDRIVEENELVDEIEIITTDTHIVNTIDAVNQVGQRIPHNELIGKIQELIKEAKEDCESVVAGMSSRKTTVTVFGNDMTETLASHANAMISMGGALTAAMIIATISISILLFLFAAA